MGRLSETTLGDLTKAAARYRPVAVTVIVIVVILALLPDRGGKGRAAVAQNAANTGGPAFNDASATTTTTAPGVDTGAPASSTAGPSTFTSPTSGSSFVSPSGSDSSSPSSSPNDTTVVEFSGPREQGDTGDSNGGGDNGGAAPETPLTVSVRAWATATAGTPLEASGVPEHSLPVGRRFGNDDKRSFVRLTGTQSVLTLAENADGSRSIPGSNASVKACPISDAGWGPAEGESFDEAPKYATDHCVAGQRSADGKWTFDLGGFPSRADDHGFALVPGDDAGIDFQVAFQ